MTCVLLAGVCGGFGVLFSSTTVRPETNNVVLYSTRAAIYGVPTGQKMSHASESSAVV